MQDHSVWLEGCVLGSAYMIRQIQLLVATVLVSASIGAAQAGVRATMRNDALAVSLLARGAIFSVEMTGLGQRVFTARTGAEVDHHWLWSTDYPQRHVTKSTMHDVLGTAH
jgi:hypothetical protein